VAGEAPASASVTSGGGAPAHACLEVISAGALPLRVAIGGWGAERQLNPNRRQSSERATCRCVLAVRKRFDRFIHRLDGTKSSEMLRRMWAVDRRSYDSLIAVHQVLRDLRVPEMLSLTGHS